MKTLTPADFVRPYICNWFRYTKAKQGPKVRWFCFSCKIFRRRPICPALEGK